MYNLARRLQDACKITIRLARSCKINRSSCKILQDSRSLLHNKRVLQDSHSLLHNARVLQDSCFMQSSCKILQDRRSSSTRAVPFLSRKCFLKLKVVSSQRLLNSFYFDCSLIYKFNTYIKILNQLNYNQLN